MKVGESTPIFKVTRSTPIFKVDESRPIFVVAENRPSLKVGKSRPIFKVAKSTPIFKVAERRPSFYRDLLIYSSKISFQTIFIISSLLSESFWINILFGFLHLDNTYLDNPTPNKRGYVSK